jgi:rubrerythrin
MTKEQDKSIAALEKAIQMEIDGKEYYLKASEKTGNELGKKLLQSLAAEEDIHRKVFEDIFENIKNSMPMAGGP